MKEWFARFNPREQVSLLVLAAALSLFLLYQLVWSPVSGMRDDMAERNHRLAEVLLRMDGMVSQIQTLRQSGASNRPRRNLASLINASTGEHELQVLRLQPNSRGEVQVRLEDAVFDKLLSWLHQVEFQEGLVVHEVSLNQTGSSGRVNATVRIGEG
jgi:type II secretory pathway component PulM